MRKIAISLLLLCLLFHSGCIGTIVVLSIIVAKKNKNKHTVNNQEPKKDNSLKRSRLNDEW